uniref:Ubiquitin carboxyl-terminal hydrolase 36 n=1 Tax=Timema tahoe TaxID=61484 RepID=A0A7R9IP30_9NEOP|nr:unnamed protein product [Timema tahoe]
MKASVVRQMLRGELCYVRNLIVVLCNSSSTLESISGLSGSPSHPLIIQILEECASLRAGGYELGYQWILSHVGIIGVKGTRKFVCALICLRLGHAYTKDRLYLMRKVPSSHRVGCHVPERLEHIFMICPVHQLARPRKRGNSMPASGGDPVSTALRLSLASSNGHNDLDNKLVASSTRVLLSHIGYELSDSFQSTVLHNLKNKYIVLKSEASLKENGSATNVSNNHAKPFSNMKPNSDNVLPTPKVTLFPAERVQLGWRGTYPVGAGMINMGNTCYLNSTLQALFHVPALVNWLESDADHLAKCSSTIICKHLMHGQQEDAHEFLRYLLESMEKAYLTRFKAKGGSSSSFLKPTIEPYRPTERPLRCSMLAKTVPTSASGGCHVVSMANPPAVNLSCLDWSRYIFFQLALHLSSRGRVDPVPDPQLCRISGYAGDRTSDFLEPLLDSFSKETTPLNQIFGGYIRTEVVCLQCHAVSTTFQHFQDLLLDIRRASTLDDALAGYFCRERLDDDAYRCERCHKKVSATKKFCIEKPPLVLCLQFKRFSIMGGKINKHVSFSQRLDLTRFLYPQSPLKGQQPLTYRLSAMVTHMGSSLHCGHYTAVALTSSGHYYHFDDSSVRPISLHSALETNAYIIIYEMERNPHKVVPSCSTPGSSTVTSSLASLNSVDINGERYGSSIRPIVPPLRPPDHKLTPAIVPVHNRSFSSMTPSVVCFNSPTVAKPTNRPAVSTIYKPNTSTSRLPPVKDRGRVAFELQPRLGVHVKNTKVNHHLPSTTSLVPYESDDSSGSDAESPPVRGLDMPSLSPCFSRSPQESNASSTLTLFPRIGQAKETVPRALDSNKGGKVLVTSNKDVGLVACQSVLSNTSVERGSVEIVSGSETLNKVRKPEVEALQVNTCLPVTPLKVTKSGWQVTDVSLHSPSVHSESSGISVASSTTGWTVSDVKRCQAAPSSPKKKTVNGSFEDLGKSSVGVEGRMNEFVSRILPGPQFTDKQLSKAVPQSQSKQTNNKSECSPLLSGSKNHPGSNSELVHTKDEKRERKVKKKHTEHTNENGYSVKPANDDRYEWVEKTQETLMSANKEYGNGHCWNGSRNSTVVDHLTKLSHRGYGTNVSSWSGGRTHLDREVADERREERKRIHDNQYDEELDLGRVKKVKHHHDKDMEYRPKHNVFQEYHNFKHQWNNNNKSGSYHNSHYPTKMNYTNNNSYKSRNHNNYRYNNNNNRHHNNGYGKRQQNNHYKRWQN